MITCFIGTTELLLIGGVALLFFGGKKLPEMMRGLGQGVRQFKEGMKDITDPEAHNNEVPEADEPQKDVQTGNIYNDLKEPNEKQDAK